ATALEASFELLGVRGAEDEVHRLPGLGGVPVPLLVLAGVGGLDDDGEASDESLRRAAGAAVRSLAGTDAVALALPADTPARLAAVAEGAVLGAYAFTAQKSECARAEADSSRPVRELEVVTPLAAADA
ncbi:leucyl aminopeptidase, partial [Xanthomonas citri pv. citri]|nr:leucyl aminopeptidase [Xanthomonas citri pv. citri]